MITSRTYGRRDTDVIKTKDTRKAKKIGRRGQALDKESVLRDLRGQCGCKHNCYRQFTAGDVLFWRQKLHCYPEGPERMTKLVELMRLTSVSMTKYKKNQEYRIDQKLICRKAMIHLILKVSVATFARARVDSLNGIVKKIHMKDKLTSAVKGKICEGFIRSYITSVCDRDPTEQRFRMPSCLSRSDIFSMYESTYQDEHLKKSMFYKILKENFKDLSFNKTQRNTKCTQCSDYRYLIENEKDPYQRTCYEAELNHHLIEQQVEREAYYVRRAQAEMRPKQFLSLILDGMDQNKTDLPHYVRWNTPNNAGTQKLRTHITGSIIHGRGKHCFIDFNQFKHNTNLTLTCLLNILTKESEEGRLPPTLYIQLDNTSRENKNKYFLAMVAYLIKKKIFSEAYISFLIVGHTHEDVDQMFSKVSHSLKNNKAITLKELHTVVQQSQRPFPTVEPVTTVWNISQWLEPCINQVHNVTFPKMYWIYNDEIGHTTIRFKSLSTDPVWRPLPSERPLEIFKLDSERNQILPEGSPEKVTPTLDKYDWEDLKGSLEKDFALAQFHPNDIQEWKSFFDDPFKEHGGGDWPLTLLKEFRHPESQEIGEKEREIIEKYKQKRNMLKEVYTSQNNQANKGTIYEDRRHFQVGKMLLVQHSNAVFVVGKVLDVKENNDVVVKIYFKDNNSNSYKPSEDTEVYPVQKCYPGTFELTNTGCLPMKIRQRMAVKRLA